MFSVRLDVFNGPLDLLLYLVRKREIDVLDVAIAEVTEQFLSFLDALEALNLDAIGDFLSLAGALVEIKSFQALPNDDEEEKEVVEIESTKKDLVVQLLSYRKFCENAGLLEERGRLWRRQYPRLSNDLPTKTRNIAEEPIHDVELWDLVGAFGRILREKNPVFKHAMKREDTPLAVHIQRVYERLKRERAVRFATLFEKADRKATLVGIFLAILELTRHGYAYVEQDVSFGDIKVSFRENDRPFDLIQSPYVETAQAG